MDYIRSAALSICMEELFRVNLKYTKTKFLKVTLHFYASSESEI